MEGILLGMVVIFVIGWIALDYSLKHDAGIDELGLENRALRDRIRELEAELKRCRRMRA